MSSGLTRKSGEQVAPVPHTAATDYEFDDSVGAAATGAPDATDLLVQDFDTYALLRWSWPAGCNQVLLGWRADTHPRAADDPRATFRRITRAEYDRHGGFHLERPAATPHHFAVFAASQVDGRLVFASGKSAGARAVMRNRACVVISYRVKRQWLRRSRFTIELRADALIEFLPMLIVVAKPGELQPISPTDGVVVLELSGVRLGPAEPVRRDLDLSAVRTPVYLRAFFAKAVTGGRFRLADPSHEQLKIQ